MADNTKEAFETVEEDYEFLDTVELDGETYFIVFVGLRRNILRAIIEKVIFIRRVLWKPNLFP